jgi:hypothetical protein
MEVKCGERAEEYNAQLPSPEAKKQVQRDFASTIRHPSGRFGGGLRSGDSQVEKYGGRRGNT